VVVGTDEFESLARLESKARGMPDLPVVITKHPIGGLKPEQVASRAGDLLDGVTAALVAPVAVGHAAD
jgi:hypothetical protein